MNAALVVQVGRTHPVAAGHVHLAPVADNVVAQAAARKGAAAEERSRTIEPLQPRIIRVLIKYMF